MTYHNEPGSDAILDEQGVAVARIGNSDLRRRVLAMLNAIPDGDDGVPTFAFEQVVRGEMVARIRFVRPQKERRNARS